MVPLPLPTQSRLAAAGPSLALLYNLQQMRIAVVIPTLDEARQLSAVVARVRAIAEVSEVVVVDGGSSDDSVARAHAAGARVIQLGRAQRAHQLNLGAAVTSAEILLFLHADTLLPRNAGRCVCAAVRNGAHGGAFRRRFIHASHWLRMTCVLADLRAMVFGVSLGDQVQFATRAAWDQLGGFDEAARYEDLDFSLRLRRLGRAACCKPCVRSSGRRFAGRPILVTLQDAVRALRWFGWRRA